MFVMLVASAAAPATARRLSEFWYADSCFDSLEQKEAIMPASNPLFDGGCKMSAESFEPSTYATLLPECTFDYSAFAGATTCAQYYAANAAFCSQIAACGDVVVSEDPGSGAQEARAAGDGGGGRRRGQGDHADLRSRQLEDLSPPNHFPRARAREEASSALNCACVGRNFTVLLRRPTYSFPRAQRGSSRW